MELKEVLFKELVKKGYSELKDGRKVWDVANRSILYMTPELVDSFLKLREHPRYQKTIVEIETELLKKNAEKLINGHISGPFNLIDLGCEDGSKAKTFIKALNGKTKVRFCSVNVSKKLASLALRNVEKENFSNVEGCKKIIADFSSLDEIASLARNGQYQKNVVLLLGSILASFDIHEYLFNLTQGMFKGDVLIIGNAIRTGERFTNLENYKDKLFKNWFDHLMRAMGFDDKEVSYDARFANGRLEGYYTINNGKKLSCGGKTFEFKKGDEIIAAILYKYYEKELEEFCKMYFREVELVKDEKSEYALVLCVK